MLTQPHPPSNRTAERFDCDDLKRMLRGGRAAVEASAAALDALNVYPVPDGDTGANMLLTLRSAEVALEGRPRESAAQTTAAIARGALMGGRGNSGVILSQWLRGFSEGMAGHETFAAHEFVVSLRRAAEAAYRAVATPVEGTMLTVARRTAEAAEAAMGRDGLGAVFQAACAGADAGVAETPALLPVLKEAGVVDAGGQGLAVFLNGAFAAFAGLPPPEVLPLPEATAALQAVRAAAQFKGFCCEFIVEAESERIAGLRDGLKAMGESLLIVGDGPVQHVHIHSEEPPEVLSYAQTFGPLSHIKVQDMREQRRELLTGGEAPAITVIAVVSGHGMEQVYLSLGAHLIIPGGLTMNPSVDDIAQAISTAASDQVILLPNNGNVIPGARQAISMSNKRVALVPTKAMTEGISALVAFSPEADLAANAEAMEEAAQGVRTLGITYATRSIRWGDVHAEAGQSLAVRGDDVLAAGDDPLVVAETALRAFGLDKAELLTIYGGSDAPLEEAHRLLERLRQQFGGLNVELVEGGQPHYRYLFAIE